MMGKMMRKIQKSNSDEDNVIPASNILAICLIHTDKISLGQLDKIISKIENLTPYHISSNKSCKIIKALYPHMFQIKGKYFLRPDLIVNMIDYKYWLKTELTKDIDNSMYDKIEKIIIRKFRYWGIYRA